MYVHCQPHIILKRLNTVEKVIKLHVIHHSSAVFFYFSSGQEVQRISVITNLPDLLRDSHADCMRRVVPKVRVSIVY